ncbi:putative TetR-family transcriptional regulator [Rhodococcoides trifolii]|uniref:TetR-family transcriptional regulator n=1 Tax=Rhodococcoides trifolii TaxID=908250 RepID=A0A917LG44_9NOCA|nr:putative TetR-family transcriptional regulator [Rhodococcus trifolii]
MERRKARTRAALVTAAQTFIADGRVTAPVLEITHAADVGMGSFYNHFASKEELFQAAVNTALDDVGDYLDSLTGDLRDPVEMFTQSFRLTGRLFRVKPELTRVLLNAGTRYDTSGRGLAPRCLRDIRAGAALGRFDVDDPELALSLVAGALLAMGRLLMEHPERDDAVAVDRMTADLLRGLGIPTDEARELVRRPLPDSYRTDLDDVVGRAAR